MWLSDKDFFGFLIVFAIFFITIGFGVGWGLPWVWDWLKPLIHAWTA